MRLLGPAKMRCHLLRWAASSPGSVAVLFMIAVPLMAAMLALVIEMGRIALSRSRIEAAADRAAYAGAAALAHGMNQIAAENWRLHKAWRDLDRDFRNDTQMNEQAARRRIAAYEAGYSESVARIRDLQDGMPTSARAAALGTLAANAPAASGQVFNRTEALLSADEEQSQGGLTGWGHVTGTIYTDPDAVEEGSYTHTKFLVKPSSPDAVVGVFAEEAIRPMLLGRLIGGVKIRASAAAQAFGGSIGEFALKGVGSLEEAEGELTEDGADWLYRAALVPMWALGEEGQGMRH